MAHKEPVPHAAKRIATAMMLLSLLGAAGCMSWQRGVTSAADDVESVTQATERCEEYGCKP